MGADPDEHGARDGGQAADGSGARCPPARLPLLPGCTSNEAAPGPANANFAEGGIPSPLKYMGTRSCTSRSQGGAHTKGRPPGSTACSPSSGVGLAMWTLTPPSDGAFAPGGAAFAPSSRGGISTASRDPPAATSTVFDQVFFPGARASISCLPGSTGTAVPRIAGLTTVPSREHRQPDRRGTVR